MTKMPGRGAESIGLPPVQGSSHAHREPIEWNQYLIDDARHIGLLLDNRAVVDVTVTSPPYWDAKDYDTPNQIGYRQSLESYLDDLAKIFSAIWRCTKPNGSLWIIMKSVKKRGQLYLLPFLLSERLTKQESCSWILRDILVWHKTHTLPWSHRQKLSDNFEYILCLSKSDAFSLNFGAIRSPDGISNWWVKYPERYHPRGKSISNVWEIGIPTQGSWGNGLLAHSCPLPVELAKRAILLSTEANGTVLDPFAGTGSIALAAEELGRRWLAVDINQNYREMFYRRLATLPPRGRIKNYQKASRLFKTNLLLRQLKFALLLFKRIAPSLGLTSQDLPLLLVFGGQIQTNTSKHWVRDVNILLVLADECYANRRAEVDAEAASQSSRPPLSKFQLDVTIKITSSSRVKRAPQFRQTQLYHLYCRGEFWRSKGVTDSGGLLKSPTAGKLPLIASDISVSEEPAY